MYNISIKFEEDEKDDNESNDRYGISFYNEEIFDFNFPFRVVINAIFDVLQEEFKNISLQIDDYLEYEDFVFFELIIDNELIA
ncbi:hypothetical protein MNBD_GAMMA12-1656, partial [hydrothermal vent metagenome]